MHGTAVTAETDKAYSHVAALGWIAPLENQRLLEENKAVTDVVLLALGDSRSPLPLPVTFRRIRRGTQTTYAETLCATGPRAAMLPAVVLVAVPSVLNPEHEDPCLR